MEKGSSRGYNLRTPVTNGLSQMNKIVSENETFSFLDMSRETFSIFQCLKLEFLVHLQEFTLSTFLLEECWFFLFVICFEHICKLAYILHTFWTACRYPLNFKIQYHNFLIWDFNFFGILCGIFLVKMWNVLLEVLNQKVPAKPT